jgi:hypothetical protein
MSKLTEAELLALKTKYLAAHSAYERCVAALSRAGLRSASTLPKGLDDLAQAFFVLQAARKQYRAALFDIAFDSEPLN